MPTCTASVRSISESCNFLLFVRVVSTLLMYRSIWALTVAQEGQCKGSCVFKGLRAKEGSITFWQPWQYGGDLDRWLQGVTAQCAHADSLCCRSPNEWRNSDTIQCCYCPCCPPETCFNAWLCPLQVMPCKWKLCWDYPISIWPTAVLCWYTRQIHLWHLLTLFALQGYTSVWYPCVSQPSGPTTSKLC